MKLLWLDVETNDVDETTLDSALLEIGVVITEGFRVISSRNYVLANSLEGVKMPTYVHDMHTKSGLLEEVANSAITYGAADNSLAGLVDRYFPTALNESDGRPMVAGRNPNFDKRWVKRFLPNFYSRLHYREFDVRTLETALKLTTTKLELPRFERDHRSMSDLLQDIELADWFVHRAMV